MSFRGVGRVVLDVRKPGSLAIVMLASLLCGNNARAQTEVNGFHWVDFHDSKDAPFVAWVTESLKGEHWSAIREIGVQWDSALVITSERKTVQAIPSADVYTVWSVSLAKHEGQALFRGVNPRIVNWTNFGGATLTVPELGMMFDDCAGCETPTTFFTTLYYNVADHAWRARWVHGDQAAALWSMGTVDGVEKTQVYGLLTEPSGRQVLATWNHLDYGKAKPAEDFVFLYGVDVATGLEQTQGLSGKHADETMDRLCRANPGQADPALGEMARGQGSELCQERLGVVAKAKPGRRPATTPPPDNHGRSTPPKAKK